MASDYVTEMIEQYTKQYEASGIPEKNKDFSVESAMIPMRDGVSLHAIIYKPISDSASEMERSKESYPVILQRTCYPDQDRVFRTHGENLAKRGYAYVYQYSRGREESEGEWVPNITERQDGIDTVNWLYGQSWCKMIGYWGFSHSALAGWSMADAVQGKVTSMFLIHYGTDRFVSAYEKGSFRHDILTAWSMENLEKPVAASYDKYLETCRYTPQSEVDEALWGERSETYRSYVRNTKITDEYWKEGLWKELREIPRHVKISVYIVSGWYDHHHESTMKTWENLNEETKKHSWLEIGGWNHGMHPCLPDKKTDHAEPEEIPRMLKWFQMTLMEGKIPEQKIRLYKIGEDRWQTLPQWNKEMSRSMCLYLSGDDNTEQDNIGSLVQNGPADEKRFSYTYDPAHPVETVSGEGLLKSMTKIGSLPQPDPGYREDVISFLSEPVKDPVEIFGKIQVRLYVKSDCGDTAFTAKLMEVTPDGKAYHIRSSITTLAHELPEDRKYVPGSAVEVTVDMWEIAYTIPAGSRIRVDVSSSDFPQYNIHSNYAGLWSEQTRVRPACQTILTGKEYPSRIVLPVIM